MNSINIIRRKDFEQSIHAHIRTDIFCETKSDTIDLLKLARCFGYVWVDKSELIWENISTPNEPNLPITLFFHNNFNSVTFKGGEPWTDSEYFIGKWSHLSDKDIIFGNTNDFLALLEVNDV